LSDTDVTFVAAANPGLEVSLDSSTTARSEESNAKSQFWDSWSSGECTHFPSLKH